MKFYIKNSIVMFLFMAAFIYSGCFYISGCSSTPITLKYPEEVNGEWLQVSMTCENGEVGSAGKDVFSDQKTEHKLRIANGNVVSTTKSFEKAGQTEKYCEVISKDKWNMGEGKYQVSSSEFVSNTSYGGAKCTTPPNKSLNSEQLHTYSIYDDVNDDTFLKLIWDQGSSLCNGPKARIIFTFKQIDSDI